MSPTVVPKPPKEVGSRHAKGISLEMWKARWQDPKFRWFALGTVAVLLVSTLGVALFFAPRGDGRKYVEIYLTDFPGDFERFQLSVSGVYVGEQASELKLDAQEFDILQYHGTGNSLLLAYGDVPNGDLGRLSIVFSRAQAYFAGQWVAIPIPHKMLTITDGLNLGADKDGALLLDLEMEKSLTLGEKGYSFEPYVKNLWEHEFSPDAPAPSDAAGRGSLAKNGFTAAPVVDPGQKREDPPAPANKPAAADAGGTSPTATGCTQDCDAGGSPPASEPDSDSSSDRVLPNYQPTGSVNDPTKCPKGDYENPNVADPAAWAQLRLLGEACGLAVISADLYSQGNDQLTFIAHRLQAGGPIDLKGGSTVIDAKQQNVETYQGAPIDVNGILDNLPDIRRVLDPVTGAIQTVDDIQKGASEIVRFGGQPLFAYTMAPAIAFKASPQVAWAISQSDAFDWVELADQHSLVEFDSLSTANINAELTPLRSYTAPDGHPYDGHGIGVAIVDSGVDGLHRDLPYDSTGLRPASAAILENCAVSLPKNTYGAGAIPLLDQSSVCASGADTDSLGHGTMVAGVLLGRPPAADAQGATLLSSANLVGYEVWTDADKWLYGSDNSAANQIQKGVAPGAKGYAISFAGDGSGILLATIAYDRLLYMLDHPQPGDPRILVVTNSWETSWTSTDENSLLYWQIDEVVKRGVTVVFSAGNGGGDGITSMTSPECVHPREGVVCVGAVEDNDQADRSRVNPWFASSRGNRFDPLTWPDLCAPGTRIRTTYSVKFSPNTVAGVYQGGGLTNPYALFTGTSAAAPYVAGVVAIIQQARRDAGLGYLSPAGVEYVLEQSAYAFPNISGGYALSNDARFNNSNYECGHGLVDAQKAVELALNEP